ncbi:GNAT family N-acetyltransferase [Alkalicoccobacillus murimartini]|uniref:GNAT superfamily N-acetyltransferase n=1 Tax=Alkalicoccobacillus murimartini TaxID=171685 RepID=A0ABT9YC41_9BACI|nr:GNAT family N-acetyltransferase [Alkalicoccobacillus murimartini]MDQ0205382.1 GNAT superfamily N-acetyltransferase [Alkalicoccobacillus murimartini]
MKHLTYTYKNFTISTDKQQLDLEVIHHFLTKESYWWAEDTPKELVTIAIENSILCYGMYEQDLEHGGYNLVGFARVISDLVRFSWLCDVFILPNYRGHGLSKWLLQVITEHPQLSGTRFNLGTNDAHTLYEQYGFSALQDSERRMERPIDWSKIYKGHALE